MLVDIYVYGGTAYLDLDVEWWKGRVGCSTGFAVSLECAHDAVHDELDADFLFLGY